MRPVPARLLGAAVVGVLAALPAVVGWSSASPDTARAERHAVTVARETSVVADAGAQDIRPGAPDLRRLQSAGTVAAPLAILAVASLAVAATDRRRRRPDPITRRAPARAPPAHFASATAR
jgi:hypothetical protein